MKENTKSRKKTIKGKTIKVGRFRLTPTHIISTTIISDQDTIIGHSSITPQKIEIEHIKNKKKAKTITL